MNNWSTWKPERRTALPLLLLGLQALSLLPGCRPPTPWKGINPEKLARITEHRALGTALLENDRAVAAAEQFLAIQKLDPGLALGFVNRAAALDRVADQGQAMLRDANAGVQLLPGAAWPRLVQAAAHNKTGNPDLAASALRKAVEIAPADPRMLGALIQQLRNQSQPAADEIAGLIEKLSLLLPDNSAALADQIVVRAERGDHAECVRLLDRFLKLSAPVPADLASIAELARKEFLAGSGSAATAARKFSNVARSVKSFPSEQAAIYGNPNDPANLLMRDWGVPPPPQPQPPLPELRITWQDVTARAGVPAVLPDALVPATAGDVDLAAGAGRAAPGGRAMLQDRPDLVFGGAGPSALWLNAPGGSQGPGFPLAPGSPLLVDLNNDYGLDLYVAGPESDAVWINPRSGKEGEKGAIAFTTAPGGQWKRLAVGTGWGEGAAFACDLDQDGDLDVLRTCSRRGQPGLRFLRNNGNATFSDLTEKSGLSFPSLGVRQVVCADFDGDLDPDIFVVQVDGNCRLFLNRRQDRFRAAGPEWGIPPHPGARSAVTADLNRDGRWDLVVAGGSAHGTALYWNRGARFELDRKALPGADGPSGFWVDVLDFDNDSSPDVALATSGGVRLFRNDLGIFTAIGGPTGDPVRWLLPLDADQDGDMDLLMQPMSQPLRLYDNDGGNGRPWMKLELQGLLNHAEQSNNSYAIGTVLTLQTVWDEQQVLVTTPQVHLGLGRADKAINLRMLFTHGVPQDLISPTAGKPIYYKQEPRGSCPYLYTWDGVAWRFACDFNWRSPLGMLAARGAPVPHSMTADCARLPDGSVHVEDGFIRLLATEELREVSYFDEIRLTAVDHPSDVGVYADERFPFGPPDPFRLYPAERRRFPVRATDGEGVDLAPLLQSRDGRYTPVPRGRYRGVLQPHDLVLDLGEIADASDVRLFLQGWVYPAGTSVNVAAAQNNAVKIIPPTLWFGDGRGGWTRPDDSIGMPCGKDKTIILDLSSRLTPGDHRIRLTTTMEIRWDAVFFVSGESPPPLATHAVPLVSALLDEGELGTPFHQFPEGPVLSDIMRPRPGEHRKWKPITGAYTRLGECAEILRGVDDRYVIMAPADQLRLAFDARSLPELPSGWSRTYFIRTDGWTKDTDPNTLEGETVEPLPFHGMRRYPYGLEERFPNKRSHREWRRRWNTRLK